MTLRWSDDLKTGIEIIDKQHLNIFDSIAKLDEFKTNNQVFYSILIDIINYAATHFSTEEEFMRNTGYPDFKHHKSCHDEFTSKLKKMLNITSDSVSIMDVAPHIVEFVGDWITQHYTNEDVKMAAFLKNANKVINT